MNNSEEFNLKYGAINSQQAEKPKSISDQIRATFPTVNGKIQIDDMEKLLHILKNNGLKNAFEASGNPLG